MECPKIIEQLTTLLQNWKGPENCAQGGERCLYDVSAFEHTKIKLKVILYSYLILKKMNECITDS